jgi:spore coat polysaccharide biosynthesis predicted glycosyltransferase SpsG
MHSKQTWCFCLEVSNQTGMGHLVRLLTLQKMLSLDMVCFYVWTDWTESRLKDFFGGQLYSILPLEATTLTLSKNVRGILIDMPFVSKKFLEQFDAIDHKVLLGCSDDRMNWANLVVNAAEKGALKSRDYLISSKTRVLEGAGYALLRPEFRKRKHPYNLLGHILIIIGGTDAARLTLKIVTAFLDDQVINKRKVIAVCAEDHPDIYVLRSIVEVRLHSVNLSDWLQEASVVITSPGNLLFESLALRVPAIAVSQNEKQVQDFKSYPWLLSRFDCGLIVNRANILLTNELESWNKYADEVNVGSAVDTLVNWLENSYEDK